MLNACCGVLAMKTCCVVDVCTSAEMQCHIPLNCSLMFYVITGIKYGSSGKAMDLLSGTTKENYDKYYDECDENTHPFQKIWTNHKHEVFTYEVFIYASDI
jgi:hypothetical protein